MATRPITLRKIHPTSPISTARVEDEGDSFSMKPVPCLPVLHSKKIGGFDAGQCGAVRHGAMRCGCALGVLRLVWRAFHVVHMRRLYCANGSLVATASSFFTFSLFLAFPSLPSWSFFPLEREAFRRCWRTGRLSEKPDDWGLPAVRSERGKGSASSYGLRGNLDRQRGGANRC